MSTVLIVDDNANQRLLVRMELEDEGYTVAEAANGKDALRRFAANAPDVVITDVDARGIDGRQLLQAALLLDTVPYVIIYSGDDTTRDDPATWAADAHLTRTSDLDPLKREIRRLVSNPTSYTAGAHSEADCRFHLRITGKSQRPSASVE